jgi:hypothetical protein
MTHFKVQEISIDYTECTRNAPTTENIDVAKPLPDLQEIPSDLVTSHFTEKANTPPKWGKKLNETYRWPHTNHEEEGVDVCILSFVIPENIRPPILFYYRLTNFYQNHRRYVKSLDIEQLKGKPRTADQIRGGECDPLEVSPDGLPYYPCGLIANSMFNDTFENLAAVGNNGEAQVYEMSDRGISWSTEKDLYGNTEYQWDKIAVPPNWKKQYPEDGYKTVGPPNLKEWEAFQVWMRTAGLPTFSKLAKRNDNDELKAGTYNLKIYSSTCGMLL